MEDILYKRNLDAIKRYDEKLYDNYLSYKKNDSDEKEKEEETEKADVILNIESHEALNGSSTYWTVETENRVYRMNSLCSPEEEASIWAEQFPMSNLELVIVLFGLGDGKFYHKLKKRGREDTKIVIFEPSIQMFEYQMNHIDMDEIVNANNTILIVDGLNDKVYYDVLTTLLTIYNYEYCLEIVVPEYDKIFRRSYYNNKKFIANMKNMLEGEYYTCVVLANLWTDNSLYALRHMKNCQLLSQYRDKFPKDVPIIIVSAGPSLDYNIEKLKEAKGKAVILATDTAMPQMVKHNIKPDFIATIDAKKSPAHLADEMCQHIPYICTDMARIEIMENHKAQKVYYQFSEYLERIFEEIGKEIIFLGSGTSVATVAFSACVAMGFKTIVFVGQDLAYRDGVSHAGRSLRREEVNQHHLEVEDINGDIVESRDEWYRFLLWFENAIRQLPEEYTVIDATEGGAKIHGSKIMTLEETINKYCIHEVDCVSIVKSIPLAMNEKEWSEFKEKIHHMFVEMDEIYALARQGMGVTEELMERLRNKKFGQPYERRVNKISQINDEILDKRVYNLLDTFMYSAEEDELGSRKSVNEMNDDLDEDEMKTYKIANEFYQSLKDVCKTFRPKLQEYYDAMLESEK